MPDDAQTSSQGASAQQHPGASDRSVRRGFEPLSTNTRALKWLLIIFTIVMGLTLWALWALLGHYLAEPGPPNVANSVAPVLSPPLRSPLEPMPRHNDLDWQDLVHLRQREDAQFRRLGWRIDPQTGQAEIPAAAMAAIAQRYSAPASSAESASPLRFPAPIPPAPAGPYESLPLANVFPPVGSAAAAEETRESVFRPGPGPYDVKNLPTKTGPAEEHNNPAGK